MRKDGVGYIVQAENLEGGLPACQGEGGIHFMTLFAEELGEMLGS